MPLNQEVLDLFGEPISTYTDEQAIEDGVLVHPFPKQWPWLLVTATVFGKCEREAERSGRRMDQVLVPLLQDCIMETQRQLRLRRNTDLVELEHTTAGTVWIRPNGKGGMTVMNPEDN